MIYCMSNIFISVVIMIIILDLIGLSFLFIEMKELCEARAKLEMSSNLADEPTLADVLPQVKTARALSELYAFECCQWEPIQNSQLIRKYKEIPVYIKIQIPKADCLPQSKLPEL